MGALDGLSRRTGLLHRAIGNARAASPTRINKKTRDGLALAGFARSFVQSDIRRGDSGSVSLTAAAEVGHFTVENGLLSGHGLLIGRPRGFGVGERNGGSAGCLLRGLQRLKHLQQLIFLVGPLAPNHINVCLQVLQFAREGDGTAVELGLDAFDLVVVTADDGVEGVLLNGL